MAKQETIEGIQEALCSVLGRDDVEISAESQARDVEGWDSLANVRLFIQMEMDFGLRFNAADIEHLKNVGNIADLIETKQD